MTNTYVIDTTNLAPRILDKTLSFPPTSNYKIIINPDPGEIIQAAQYSSKEMSFSYEGDTNSNTRWPSRFQWEILGLGEPDDTLSGLKEFPTFYKIVFEDSTNHTNDSNWIADRSNRVYIWVYFGKNEETFVNNSQGSSDPVINIERYSTLITQEEVVNPVIATKDKNINSFNF